MADPGTPSRDDNATTSPPDSRQLCPVCWTPFHRIRRQRYCSDGCRKTAWRRRQQPAPASPEPVPQARRRRDVTVYSCPACDTRYYGQQWCPDCHQPCTRIGLGGLCPHCDEPVAITDLLDTNPTEVITPQPLR
jgi:predicted amidophosphoribosyltransferase